MARHLKIIDQALTDTVSRGGRLIISMPPRHGKSELVSKFFPAWLLGTCPDRRIILSSYEADFASSWGRKARSILEEEGYLFGVRISPVSSSAQRWDIAGHSGGMVTAGVGGPITGKGADVLIIDDPIKNDEEARSQRHRDKIWEWFQSTAYTRLEPGGSIVLIMTRWHRDDLVGRLQEAERGEFGEPWTVLRLPAIAEDNDPLGRDPGEALWPERWPIDSLRQKQTVTGAYYWGCLYQQNPGAEGGAEWPDSYFGSRVWFDDWPKDLTAKVVVIDPSKGKDAKHGDYSAIVDIGRCNDGTLWVDADLKRRPVSDIVNDGLERYRYFHPLGIALETNVFQELLKDEFERVSRERGVQVPIFPVVNMVKKEVRIRRLGPLLANGTIRFKAKSPGTKLLVQQLKDFPNGDHDDGPDALETGIRKLDELCQRRSANRVERMRL